MSVPDPAPAHHAGAPAWLHPHDLENLAPAALAIAVAAGLQLALPAGFVLLRPHWLLPALELLLLLALVVLEWLPGEVDLRRLSFLLLGIVSVDNAVSSVLLSRRIITGAAGTDALPLLATGGAIWVTNVIAYGIWFWLLDRGGPNARAEAANPYPDLLFPQMGTPGVGPPTWHPLFVDYLYVSLTNAMAFSPTDTMPLTRRAKTLMALQSLVAVSTMALVLARAVNILH